MDFNEILNSTIAGLICSGTVALLTFTYKILNAKYKEDSTLFLINLNFYLGLVFLVISCLEFNLETIFTNFLSVPNLFNLIFFICIIINLANILIAYKNIKKYIKYSSNHN